MTAPLPAAVLFDMDGTLVDTERLWWDAAAMIAASIGRPLTDADAPDVLGRPVSHTAAHLFATGGPDVPSLEVLAHELDEAFTLRVAHEIVPQPGAMDLLEELAQAGIPAAIVSASPRRVVDLVHRALGSGLFVTTVAVEDTEVTKPAADPYLEAAARLDVDPRRCVAVEDTPVGLAAAEAAGCAVIVVPTDHAIAAAPGRTILGSLAEANLELLRSLAPAAI